MRFRPDTNRISQVRKTRRLSTRAHKNLYQPSFGAPCRIKVRAQMRSEILCRELAHRVNTRGIGCLQTNGGMPQRNKDRKCAEGKGNGEEAGAKSAAYLRGGVRDRNAEEQEKQRSKAAEKQEREARSEILCRELAGRRARSIPVGISCSQTCELTQRKRSAPALSVFPPRI